MDIQKEQNSFKKTMLDQHGEYDEEHFELDSYGNFSWIGTDDHFEIWMLCAKAKQAEIDELKGRLAKAQAVPEGFVLVKKVHPDAIVHNQGLGFFKECQLIYGWDGKSKDFKDALNKGFYHGVKLGAKAVLETAMIEAQEPAND